LLVRPTTSSVFAYLSVAALCVGTLIIFGLVTAAFGTTKVTHTASIPVTGPDGTTTSQTYTTDETRTDRTWWLLSPNPFVVLADAAPASSSRTISGPDGAEVSYQRLDPLGGLGHTVRRLRLAPQDQDTIGLNASDSGDDNSLGGPVWPTGLIVNVSLGILALAVTRLRLVTPTRKLPRGVRIA